MWLASNNSKWITSSGTPASRSAARNASAPTSRNHSYRVPVQPALPHLRAQHPRPRVERQLDGAVRVRRKAGRHAEQHEQVHVRILGEGGAGPEVGPPAPDVPTVVAQVTHALAELGHVAELVQ